MTSSNIMDVTVREGAVAIPGAGRNAVYVIHVRVNGEIVARLPVAGACRAAMLPSKSIRSGLWIGALVIERSSTPKARHGSASAMRRGARIKWNITTQKARQKLACIYPEIVKESKSQ
jgi:hypothetical protein